MEQLRFSSSRPVTTPGDDAFGRTPFARQLATMVAGNSGPEPPVLGVVGGWGTGKTSVLNLIQHFINEGDGRIPVIWFNPWRHAAGGRGAIQAAVLEQVAGAVLTSLGKKTRKRVRDLVSKYGTGAMQATRLVPYAGGALADVGTSALAHLPDSRRKLVEALKADGRRVVVMVDDVDRLTGTELLELFAALRVVGDLPHVQYVLAYDSKYVATALESATGTRGVDFIEKVVEIPIPVPAITFDHLHSQFRLALREVLTAEGMDASWLDGHAGVVVEQYLRSTLQTPRDLIRFLNRLRALAGLAAGAELVPEDFVACEFLAVFYANLHQALHTSHSLALLASRAVVLDSLEDGERSQRTRESARQAFTSYLGTEGTPRYTSALNAVRAILPDLASAIEQPTSFSVGFAEASGRLADPAYFGRYFSYTAWLDDVPDGEVRARWQGVLQGGPVADGFDGLIEERTEGVLQDKLVREISNSTLDAATALRIASELVALDASDRNRSWSVYDVFGYRTRRLDPSLLAAQVITAAPESRRVIDEFIRTVGDTRAAFDTARAWLEAQHLADPEATAIRAELGQLIGERLAEPEVLEEYRSRREQLTDVARFAALSGSTAFIKPWSEAVREDPELINTVLAVTMSVQLDKPEHYLGRLSTQPRHARPF